MWLTVFTWTGMVSSSHSLTGPSCSPQCPCMRALLHQMIQLTLARTPCKPQITQCIFKPDITFSTPWPLFAISWLCSFTGSWWERSNRESMESMRTLDGEDLFTWSSFIPSQEPPCWLTRSAQTVFWRKTTGNWFVTWWLYMEPSCGSTFYQQECSSSHSWTSPQEKHSRTCSGLTLLQSSSTSSSALLTRGSSQSTMLPTSTHTTS